MDNTEIHGHWKRWSQSNTTVDPANIRGLGTTLLASVRCLRQSRSEDFAPLDAVEGCTTPGRYLFPWGAVLSLIR